jgi:hypothetical protein
VDFAQFTLNRRIQEHNLPFENNSTPGQTAPLSANGNQMNPELKAAMEDYLKSLLVEPQTKAMQKAGDEKLLIDIQLNSPGKPSIQPQNPEDPAWSKFTHWLNDNFGPKQEKHPLNPQPVGAVRG